MYCVEQKHATLLGHLDAPQWFGTRGILPPSLRPWCNTSRESAQLWSLQSPGCRTTYRDWEITATLFRPCIQNAPRKTGEASPSG